MANLTEELHRELLDWAETVDYRGRDKQAIVADSFGNIADVDLENKVSGFQATVMFLIEDPDGEFNY